MYTIYMCSHIYIQKRCNIILMHSYTHISNTCVCRIYRNILIHPISELHSTDIVPFDFRSSGGAARCSICGNTAGDSQSHEGFLAQQG